MKSRPLRHVLTARPGHRSVRFALYALTSLAVACSGPLEDGSDALESDYTVQPTGGSSSVTLKGFPASAIVHLAKQSGKTKTVVSPGVAVPVSPGTYCVSSVVDGVESKADCSLNVSAGNALTYTMGSVELTRSCTDDVFGIDVLAYHAVFTDLTAVRAFAKHTGPFPHPAGTFAYSLARAAEKLDQHRSFTISALDIAVAEGAATIVDVCDTSGDWSARVLPPPKRELPSYRGAFAGITLAISSGHAVTEKTTVQDLARPVRFTARIPKGEFAPMLEFTSKNRIPFAAPGKPSAEVQLGRIDVKDVRVTMPDGSVKEASGKYSLKETVTGWASAGISTGFGVDVLPGHYVVTVEYPHPIDGATMTDVHEADVP